MKKLILKKNKFEIEHYWFRVVKNENFNVYDVMRYFIEKETKPNSPRWAILFREKSLIAAIRSVNPNFMILECI